MSDKKKTITIKDFCHKEGQLVELETNQLQTAFRKMRPIPPETARDALDKAYRQLGPGLHVDIYIDALQTALVRARTKKGN